jgi:hypothetical protein
MRCAPGKAARRRDSRMIDAIGGLLMGVLQFYAWTVGLGLVALFLIMVVESAIDLIRDLRPWHTRRSTLSRRQT